MYSISYVLKSASNVSIAYFVYHVPSPIKVLREAPARFAQVAVHESLGKSDINNENHNSDTVETSIASSSITSTYFDKVCMYSISHHHDLSGVIAIQSDDPSILVLQSKVPYISTPSGKKMLNFRGRGTCASPKNMQLIASTTMPQTKTKSGKETPY